MSPTIADPAGQLCALVLHPIFPGSQDRDHEYAVSEAKSLATALDLDVAAAISVPVARVRAGSFFGDGKLSEIGGWISDAGVELVIVDGTLSPVQQRNLEREWKCKVLDRTGLILEIFGERAQTREGVLQVELAHLNYQKSRLVRSWTHLERQRGGMGFLGGPGETQIESDRRALDARIGSLRKALARVAKTRSQHRAARRRTGLPVVALVGYTNAGKSTLFNHLSGAGVTAKDMLFATLDPTLRAVTLPGGKSIGLTDTVGFISELPTQLVAAFRSTLEEVVDADLILHVRDISHPETEHQATHVTQILAEIGVGEDDQARIMEVWNKADLLSSDQIEASRNTASRSENVMMISAVTGQGTDALLAEIGKRLAGQTQEEMLTLDYDDGRRRAWLFDHNVVTGEAVTDTGFEISVCWTDQERNQYEQIE